MRRFYRAGDVLGAQLVVIRLGDHTPLVDLALGVSSWMRQEKVGANVALFLHRVFVLIPEKSECITKWWYMSINCININQHTDCSKALSRISLWFLDAYVTCFVRIGEVKELGHLVMKLPQEPVTATTKFHLLDISKLIVPRLSHGCQKCLGISCCPKSLGGVWGYIFMSAYKHPVESLESISFYVPSTGRQEVELLWLSHILSSFGVSRWEPQWSK